MATNYEVLAKANELEAALDGLMRDPAYAAYESLLATRQADVVSASNSFTADDPSGTVLAAVKDAVAECGQARPTDADMTALAEKADRATMAMNSA
jgi:hypothetical protein